MCIYIYMIYSSLCICASLHFCKLVDRLAFDHPPPPPEKLGVQDPRRGGVSRPFVC